ncbi:MAG: hypothetical protein NZO16_01120 [Deltaproteobacteria bacterium]|nr:hypothetical protein [Deltaproteobacteria bacterium]
MKRVLFFLLVFTGCSAYLSQVDFRFEHKSDPLRKQVFLCKENGKSYVLTLIRDSSSKTIVLEDASSIFRYSVLRASYSNQTNFQVSSSLKERLKIMDDLINSFEKLFFPETIQCCKYVDNEGFYRTDDKSFGVKIGQEQVFRIYRGRYPLIEKIVKSPNEFILKAEKVLFSCNLQHVEK